MAILATGCRQGIAAMEDRVKTSIAHSNAFAVGPENHMPAGACGQGILAVSAWECLTGSKRSAEASMERRRQ